MLLLDYWILGIGSQPYTNIGLLDVGLMNIELWKQMDVDIGSMDMGLVEVHEYRLIELLVDIEIKVDYGIIEIYLLDYWSQGYRIMEIDQD